MTAVYIIQCKKSKIKLSVSCILQYPIKLYFINPVCVISTLYSCCRNSTSPSRILRAKHPQTPHYCMVSQTPWNLLAAFSAKMAFACVRFSGRAFSDYCHPSVKSKIPNLASLFSNADTMTLGWRRVNSSRTQGHRHLPACRYDA